MQNRPFHNNRTPPEGPSEYGGLPSLSDGAEEDSAIVWDNPCRFMHRDDVDTFTWVVWLEEWGQRSLNMYTKDEGLTMNPNRVDLKVDYGVHVINWPGKLREPIRSTSDPTQSETRVLCRVFTTRRLYPSFGWFPFRLIQCTILRHTPHVPNNIPETSTWRGLVGLAWTGSSLFLPYGRRYR